MTRLRVVPLALVAFATTALAAGETYPLLFADPGVVNPGEAVVLRHAMCEPYAGVATPILTPQSAVVFVPDGTFMDLDAQFPKEGGSADWSIAFTPKLAGDHVVALQGQPYERGIALVQDFVKVVVHVEGSERGWERPSRQRLEVAPLSRPYGVAVGAVWRAQVLAQGQPVAGALVTCEPWIEGGGPGDVPTYRRRRLERTGAGGELSVTFDRPGWWMLSAEHAPGRQVQRGGSRLQEVLRAVFWVKVDG